MCLNLTYVDLSLVLIEGWKLNFSYVETYKLNVT